MVCTTKLAENVRFDVAFKSFLAMFNGACKKFIPLSGMEVAYRESFAIRKRSECHHA